MANKWWWVEPLLACSLASLASCSRQSLFHIHAGTGHQIELTIGYDLLTGFESLFDDCLTTNGVTHCDWTNFYRLVGFDDKNIPPLLSHLHRHRRYCDRIRFLCQFQNHSDELPWGKPFLGIGKGGFQLNRARCDLLP